MGIDEVNKLISSDLAFSCQSCAELGKECPEHQRVRSAPAYQSCMLCTAIMPCHTHKPITDTADTWKAGFDALTGRVAQLKTDLAFEQTRHVHTRKQLDAALEVIAAMQRNGNEPNQEIHG